MEDGPQGEGTRGEMTGLIQTRRTCAVDTAIGHGVKWVLYLQDRERGWFWFLH